MYKMFVEHGNSSNNSIEKSYFGILDSSSENIILKILRKMNEVIKHCNISYHNLQWIVMSSYN